MAEKVLFLPISDLLSLSYLILYLLTYTFFLYLLLWLVLQKFYNISYRISLFILMPIKGKRFKRSSSSSSIKKESAPMMLIPFRDTRDAITKGERGRERPA